MTATESEMTTIVPDVEVRRHASYWHGFCRFMTVSAIGIVILLSGMALFLL